MGERTSPSTKLAFGIFLLAMLPAAIACRPRLDEDAWWHLRVGQYLAEHRALPVSDPFSQIGIEEGARWAAYSWLCELPLYGFYKAFGLSGVLYFRYLLVFATFLVLACFATRNLLMPVQGLGALSLMTIAVLPLMSERPWHCTIVGTILTLDVVLRLRAGEPAHRFWWLPPFYIVWANVHIQFVLGLGVLGLAWVVTLLEQWRGKRNSPAHPGNLFWLGAACTAATLLTPFHVRLYGIIWEYATQTTPLRNVQELMPPDFSGWWNWPMVACMLGALIAVARRRFPLWECALLATGLFFSLRMQRDLWYGCLTALAVLTRHPGGLPGQALQLSWRAVFVAVLLGFVVVRACWQFVPGPGVEAEQAKDYPAGAVAFVRQEHLPGPLFNEFNWGGYLIWNLPELPVSIDGRTNFYGEERLRRSFETWAGQDDWQDNPELDAARLIIAPRTQLLTKLLLEHPERWRVAYADEVAVVFVPVGAPPALP